MSVESFLSRELNVRFIDARMFVTEAKLALGVEGYYGEEQEAGLIKEAMRIFEKLPLEEKVAMRRLRKSLDFVKRRSNWDCISLSDEHSIRSENASSLEGSPSRGTASFKFWSVRPR
jgi:hypothetical protein